MTAYLDIIILLFVVVMVIHKLKTLLGTRPDGQTKVTKEDTAQIFDLLQKKYAEVEGIELTPIKSEQEMSETERVLSKISGFNQGKFINGAKRAFEIIINSFAQGDVSTLEPLISKSLYKKFKDIIDQRKTDGVIAESDLITFNSAEIVDAKINKSNIAKIAVRFVSEQVNILKNSAGEVIEGDENFIQSITDIWTFEKSLSNNNPIWLLTSTKK